MPDVPVLGFVLWRDAKGNSPSEDFVPGVGPKWTNVRTAYWRKSTREWCCEVDGAPLDPQPTVWCDPSPPDMNDPLTVEDLRLLLNEVREREGVPYMYWRRVAAAAARLRRALDQISTHERKDDT